MVDGGDQSKGVMWAEFRSFEDEASWAVDSLFELYQGEPENITIMKPSENKKGKEFWLLQN